MSPKASRGVSRPTVVMYVIGGLSCGGAEMVLLELIRGLDRERFRPVVVSLKPPAVLSDQFRAAGAELYHFNMRRAVEAPITIARIARLAGRLKPEILHGIMFYGDVVCRVLKLLNNERHVISAVHSTYVGPPVSRELLRKTDRLVDAVTAVSEAIGEHHVRLATTRAEKLVVIPNGIDELRFRRPSENELERLRDDLGISANRVVLTVGRHEKEKNFPLLLRAFSLLDVPDCVLVMVGDGSLRQALEAEAEALGIRAQVRFLGHVAPVNPLFHLSDVFVMSSDVEGLPLVMLEAMAAGVPMVLTRVGGIPDVVEDGTTGLLVPPGDARALAHAMGRMMRLSSDARQRFVSNARLVFRSRFSVQTMVSDTQRLYTRLLVQARGGSGLGPR